MKKSTLLTLGLSVASFLAGATTIAIIRNKTDKHNRKIVDKLINDYNDEAKSHRETRLELMNSANKNFQLSSNKCLSDHIDQVKDGIINEQENIIRMLEDDIKELTNIVCTTTSNDDTDNKLDLDELQKELNDLLKDL